MATIYTRETGNTAVNRALTNAELDNNFINLNADVATRILSSEKAAANGVATLDAAGKLLTAQLPATGVTAGSYGSATAIPVITVDATGRLTLVSTIAVSIPSGSISVTGGDFTLSGNTGTAITNATLATVNSNTGTFNTVTVNAKGLVTAATNAAYVLSGDITALKKQEFTATAAQTTFTITDGYATGTVQVFANGILLASEDFTATNGTTVVLAQARVAGDNIIVTSGGTFQPSGGTTTNALTIGAGLTLNSGTTFNGSAARTLSLATSGVSAGTYGSVSGSSISYVPTITVDTYGRITNISQSYFSPSGSGANSFANIYANTQGTTSTPLGSSPAVLMNASSSSDTLYLFAGQNITMTATSAPNKTITISATGSSSASSITWTGNTSSGGNISVANPTGYSTSGSTLVIVVVGMTITSASASSGYDPFNTAYSVASQTKVFYIGTGPWLGNTTTISGISGYAMAYAYIAGGSSGLSSSNTSTSSTSASISSPGSNTGSPRIIATAYNASLTLSTLAGPATGGGPTWAAPSGFAHPLDSSLTAAVWVGTGSWTTTANPTLTSNPGYALWYVTGLTTFS